MHKIGCWQDIFREDDRGHDADLILGLKGQEVLAGKIIEQLEMSHVENIRVGGLLAAM
jgi:hypothetical protein